MKITKPRIMSGFQENLPEEQLLFEWMIGKIRKSFQLFGYTPIETPSIELAEIMLAKGNGETEKEIYRFKKGRNDMVLPYDLTIPTARYVTQHQNDIFFPFRRYQIQKVWRAERAQKGRLREFYQCDVDIIGSESLMCEVEVPEVMYTALKSIGLNNFKFQINSVNLLKGFLDYLTLSDSSIEILRSIDKITKIGTNGVVSELDRIGVPEDKIKRIMDFIAIDNISANEILEQLKQYQIDNPQFKKGLSELSYVINKLSKNVPETHFCIDLSISRGIDYYTGIVYETRTQDFESLGSICSGGRYENLSQYFSKKKISGIGMSIGLSRLFSSFKGAIENKKYALGNTKVLLISQDENKKNLDEISFTASKLRKHGINAIVSFEEKKIGEKLKYANRLNIPFVLMVGEQEKCNSLVSLKNMLTGEQMSLSVEDVIKTLRS